MHIQQQIRPISPECNKFAIEGHHNVGMFDLQCSFWDTSTHLCPWASNLPPWPEKNLTLWQQASEKNAALLGGWFHLDDSLGNCVKQCRQLLNEHNLMHVLSCTSYFFVHIWTWVACIGSIEINQFSKLKKTNHLWACFWTCQKKWTGWFLAHYELIFNHD